MVNRSSNNRYTATEMVMKIKYVECLSPKLFPTIEFHLMVVVRMFILFSNSKGVNNV